MSGARWRLPSPEMVQSQLVEQLSGGCTLKCLCTALQDVLAVNKDQLTPAIDNFDSAQIPEGAAEELSQPLTWLQVLDP